MSEKDILLIKLKQGTITLQESRRLREILEKERNEAIAKDLVELAIAIGGLILLITVLSQLLSAKEEKA